ncbi:MAG: DMT family transporter [Acidobacteriaceae bacterium]
MSGASSGLSLGCSLFWGAGDFSGGMATKTRSPFRVVLGAHGTGLLLAVLLALLVHEPLPAWNAVLWGAIGGVAGGLALAAFYRALAIGSMGINAPVAAIITTALPVFLSFRTQGAPKPLQIAGFVLAAISIVLVSRPGKMSGPPRGLGLAILAGVGFGIFLVGMQRAGTAHVLWPLSVARLASVVTAGAIILVTRDRERGSGSWWLIVAAGSFDTIGNALFMLATQHGRLDVAAALSSLYPITTVLLAYFINHEHVHRVQAIGSVLAIVAVPLIAM